MKITTPLLGLMILAGAAAYAGEHPKEHPTAASMDAVPASVTEKADAASCPLPEKSCKEFGMIKRLKGEWKGTGDMGGKKSPSTTSFRVTSGGSAIIETMDGGTPHEMVNVYNVVDGKLMMTHYCAMGNAPLMKVMKADGKSLTLEAVNGNGVNVKKDTHMHGLVLSMTDDDHLTATWSSKGTGKDGQKAVFEYERVAAAR